MKRWQWLTLAAGGGGLLLLWQDQAQVRATMTSIADALARLKDFLAGLGVEAKVAQAIMAVEAGGRTGFVNGRLLIRFEPHIFPGGMAYKAVTGSSYPLAQVPLLPGMSRANFLQGGSMASNEGLHRRGGQDDEYAVLAQAVAINPEAAYRSISMGPFQVMGFNYGMAGFSSATEMYNTLSQDQGAAFTSFVTFLTKYLNGKLITYMRDKNWMAFASTYNGDQTGTYAKKMQAAYDKLG